MQFDWHSFCNDAEALEDAVQWEAAAQWDGQVGPWLSPQQSAQPNAAEVQQMMQQVKLQEIILDELQRWIESWNIGIALEATLTCARRCIRPHLATLTPEQESCFDALLLEAAQAHAGTPLRLQLLPMLQAMLTPEDWADISQGAALAVEQYVLQLEPSCP